MNDAQVALRVFEESIGFGRILEESFRPIGKSARIGPYRIGPLPDGRGSEKMVRRSMDSRINSH